MKKEELFELLGKVDDELLEKSENPLFQTGNSRKKSTSWQRYSAIAACFLLIFVAQKIYQPNEDVKESLPTEAGVSSRMEEYSTESFDSEIAPEAAESPSILPDLSLDPSWESGMGFSAMMHPDFSQDYLATPWKVTSNLKKLPVYRNSAFSKDGFPNKDKTELMQAIKEVEQKLGTPSLNYEEARFDGRLYALHGTSSRYRIDLFAKEIYDIFFEEPILLPKEYRILNYDNKTQMIDTLSYLTNEYRILTEWSNPQIALEEEFDINNKLSVKSFVYDKSGTLAQQIVNYNLNRLMFYSTKDDVTDESLYLIRRANYLASDVYIGDFELISLEEAKKQLENGYYFTSVPDSYQLGEIAAVEIAYLTSPSIEYRIPYYLFYVKLLDENGIPVRNHPELYSYGFYYVPAVTEDFSNIYEGPFN